MVLTKHAKVNGLYILKDDTSTHTGERVTNVYLVRLIEIGRYGGKSFPIINKLIKLKPDYGIMKPVADSHYQWYEYFYLKHKSVKEEVKMLSEKPMQLFDAIFKKTE